MKFTRVTTLAVMIAAMLAFVSGCKSEQKATLAFAPEKGKKYEFVMKSEQDIEMEQMGQKVSSKNNMDFTYVMAVMDRGDNKHTTIVTTFKKIRFASKNPFMTMEYDSDKPSANADDISGGLMAKAFGAMVNKEVTIVVNEKGEVVSLKGMEAIFENMMKNMGLDSMPDAAATMASVKAQFSDEKFKKSFDDMFRVLPGKEVALGESWEIESDKNIANMDMKTKNVYTLKEVKDKNAVVDVVSNINVTKSGAELGGAEMTMNGKQTGTMKVDVKTGMVMEGNINQDIDAVTKAGGMEMPMKIKSTITLTSKEL